MHPDDVSDDIQGLLRTLDHSPPTTTVDAIAARARRPAPRLSGWRWAAGMLLALGAAGAAFALPGSPLRRWVSALVSGRQPLNDRAVTADAQRPAGGQAGIAVQAGRMLVIVINQPGPGSVALVSLGQGIEVTVRAPVGAATFTTDENRLLIEGRGAAPRDSGITPDTLLVDLPRSSPHVELRAGGRLLFLKQGDRVSSPVPSADDGPWLLPLSAPPRTP